ncbi:hypothetical protein CGCA056_v006333 [Colletotrichum aenigma]|uniref:uncharacterized protein n=1 Tax=Colletotrichum aenigma TaxID=1215731 RepID=UPI0018727EAF|nr:uncharacterized protein CGCA056_v006333 [Colletotrichum aenigma]KAF5522649.1 hypothetical protein CGCA056_v006333 [Colletotrichum aenigma]
MICDYQTQSAFISRLPREVRDAIYFQLWRSCGLRQHILWHGTAEDKHFCRWSCTAEYQVEDELQRDIEKMREQLGVSLGQKIVRDRHDNAPRSNECLQSIYESTTFIFTDLATVQMFFGACAIHPAMKTAKPGVTPPAFFKHARSLEQSLSPDFPALLMCANYDLPGIPRRHDVYDFDWLRFDKFKNLKNVCIWIAARSLTCGIEANSSFCCIKEFDAQGLKNILSSFKTIESVTLSTPLSQRIGPQEGYVDIGAAPGSWIAYMMGSFIPTPQRKFNLHEGMALMKS